MDECKFAFLLPSEVKELQTSFTETKVFLSLSHTLSCDTSCHMTNTALPGVFHSACSRQNCRKVRHTIGKSFTLCCSSSAGLRSPAATVCCAFSWPLRPPLPTPNTGQPVPLLNCSNGLENLRGLETCTRFTPWTAVRFDKTIFLFLHWNERLRVELMN